MTRWVLPIWLAVSTTIACGADTNRPAANRQPAPSARAPEAVPPAELEARDLEKAAAAVAALGIDDVAVALLARARDKSPRAARSARVEREIAELIRESGDDFEQWLTEAEKRARDGDSVGVRRANARARLAVEARGGALALEALHFNRALWAGRSAIHASTVSGWIRVMDSSLAPRALWKAPPFDEISGARNADVLAIGIEQKALVFEATTGRKVGTHAAQERVSVLALSPDGRFLAGSDGLGDLVVWRQGESKAAWAKYHPAGPAMPRDLLGVLWLRVDAGARLFVGTQTGPRAFNLATGRELPLPKACVEPTPKSSMVSADGELLLLASEGTPLSSLRICATKGPTLHDKKSVPWVSVYEILTRDTLLADDQDGFPRVVDVKAGRWLRSVEGTPIALSAAGDLITLTLGQKLATVETSTGRVLGRSKNAHSPSANGHLKHGILVVSAGVVNAWDARTGAHLCEFINRTADDIVLVDGKPTLTNPSNSYLRIDARTCQELGNLTGAPNPPQEPDSPGPARLARRGEVLDLVRASDSAVVGTFWGTTRGAVFLGAHGAVESWGDGASDLVTSIRLPDGRVLARGAELLWDRAHVPEVLPRALSGEIVEPPRLPQKAMH